MVVEIAEADFALWFDSCNKNSRVGARECVFVGLGLLLVGAD